MYYLSRTIAFITTVTASYYAAAKYGAAAGSWAFLTLTVTVLVVIRKSEGGVKRG